jgi:ABC-type transport system involved in multi-copper enzyme maturation permease subunit
MQVTFAIFALIGGAVGEVNVIHNEKIYVLSKPINRSTFLFAKCMSSLTMSVLLAIPTILMLSIIAICEAAILKINIFNIRYGENPYAIYGSFIMILIMSSFLSSV